MTAVGAPLRAQSPQLFEPDTTRYMALGDSIAAGYRAMPVTNAYPYLLYKDGAFDTIPHSLFCNAAVPGAASRDVLLHQVPQALIPAAAGGFRPQYITLTVGGNDLLSIMQFASSHPDQGEVLQFGQQVLTQYGQNLASILFQLRTGLPSAKIFVSNQYTVPEIEMAVPAAAQLIAAFNGIVANVAGQFPGVYVVDVYGAFAGANSVLLVERHGAGPFEDHPTSLGHRVIAQAFADAIAAAK
jgi:lysophospholipase L1-like esterase